MSSSDEKIFPLPELANVLARHQAHGQRVVHCHGVFDLLHIGHIRHLEAARKLGDVLVVTLTDDQFVNKGPHRPAFPGMLRAEMLASLGCVDYVAINPSPTAVDAITALRPDFYVKGSEYRNASEDVTGGILLEEQAVRAAGGELAFTDEITYSSSQLINQHLSTLPAEFRDFLHSLRQSHGLEKVLAPLEKARDLRTLVIGESIIDDYHYCEALGKAGKEPILVVRHRSSEKFIGGILAVANHVASFSDHVDVVSTLGTIDSHEEYIRERLHHKVRPWFFKQVGAPTIVKRRFIERYPFQKLFEVYLIEEDNEPTANPELLAHVERTVADYDVVIVNDYGHGLLTPDLVDLLCRKARRLAVNTQANAGNHGFNTVSKYPRADYVCVSEYELRLELRQRRQALDELIKRTAQKLGCRRMIVTQGRDGMLCLGDQGLIRVPAFSRQFTDRVGAGDAVFAITSLLMAQDISEEIMGLVGNVVGALAVTVVGNRTPIEKAPLIKSITSLFK